MKAISLWQPWASLVEIGAKRWETRGWQTKYRGLLAIHCAQKWTRQLFFLTRKFPFMEAFKAAGMHAEHTFRARGGHILAVVELTDIIPTIRFLITQCHRTDPPEVYRRYKQEVCFGDYGPSRFAWKMENIRALKVPVPCTGRQGIWTLPQAIETAVNKELALS